jgi:hypothetical protein
MVFGMRPKLAFTLLVARALTSGHYVASSLSTALGRVRKRTKRSSLRSLLMFSLEETLDIDHARCDQQHRY